MNVFNETQRSEGNSLTLHQAKFLCKEAFCLSVKAQIGAAREKSVPSTLIGALQIQTAQAEGETVMSAGNGASWLNEKS